MKGGIPSFLWVHYWLVVNRKYLANVYLAKKEIVTIFSILDFLIVPKIFMENVIFSQFFIDEKIWCNLGEKFDEFTTTNLMSVHFTFPSFVAFTRLMASKLDDIYLDQVKTRFSFRWGLRFRGCWVKFSLHATLQ